MGGSGVKLSRPRCKSVRPLHKSPAWILPTAPGVREILILDPALGQRVSDEMLQCGKSYGRIVYGLIRSGTCKPVLVSEEFEITGRTIINRLVLCEESNQKEAAGE